MARLTHQLRTYKAYNLHLLDASDCIGGVWPAVQPSNAKPNKLTTFYPKSAAQNSDAFCHFFIDDYRFEKVWREPERYVPVLRKYAGAIMPDFSTYHIMPLPMQWWNMYRNRAMMYYWQECGIEVIPLLKFGDPRTYDYAFEGLPVGGTYAITNNGLMLDKENKYRFYESLEIAIDAVRPDFLVCYGREMDYPFPCEFRWYKNDNAMRVRNNALPEPKKHLDMGFKEWESDGVPRAISTLSPEKRKPLMYNDELEGWEPFYVRELGYALPGTNPPSENGTLMRKEILALMGEVTS